MSDTMKIIVGIVGAVVALAGVAAAAYFVVKKVMSKYSHQRTANIIAS